MLIELDTPNHVSTFIEKIDVIMNDNKVVTTFTSKPFTGEIDISKFSPGYHVLKAIAYTKDGVKLESAPVTINFSNDDNDGFDRYRNANKDVFLENHVFLENKYSLTNRLEPSASSDRKLLISNSPERLLPDTNPILFDSNVQEGNFRLMFYHENQVPAQVTLGIEIENTGATDLIITEKAGYCSGLYGNTAGYYSQEHFFKVKDGEKKDYWDPNFQIRDKVYTIPAKSKMIIFRDGITYKKTAAYIGDFDLSYSGTYVVRVAYTRLNTMGPLENVFGKNQLSLSDGLHARGVFSNSDFSIDVDTASSPTKNICFQVGKDDKTFSSESNIHPELIGYSQDGIIKNDGHFGELYDVNIKNEKGTPLTIVVEFRGSSKGCPSFLIYKDINGVTKGTTLSRDTGLFQDKQFVMDKTSEKLMKYTLCIPAGMNGPLYIYVIKDN